MKTVQLSELGAVADEVRNGETVEVRDGENVVAKVVPTREQTLEERVAELEKQGLVRRGSGARLPDDFFTRTLPESAQSVLEQLLEDRRSAR